MEPVATMNPADARLSPEEIALRRRRARALAIKLAAFALFVYGAFIIAFINR
jgi:hypothetical protein